LFLEILQGCKIIQTVCEILREKKSQVLSEFKDV